MLLKLTDTDIVYPYYKHQLLNENPQVSFPSEISDDLFAEYNVYKVSEVECPTVTYKQNISEGTPELVDGVWTQVWVITDKTTEEINELHEQMRAEAYRNESDPLFFKAQRGEIELQVWLDKVEEIKSRYPKVN